MINLLTMPLQAIARIAARIFSWLWIALQTLEGAVDQVAVFISIMKTLIPSNLSSTLPMLSCRAATVTPLIILLL